MKEYPTKRPACEKKAIIIKLTCPNILVILSAPYKNGTLLIVPTVMVIPIRNNSIFKEAPNLIFQEHTKQIIWSSQLFQIQEQEAFDKSPKVAKDEQEDNEGNDMWHFQ